MVPDTFFPQLSSVSDTDIAFTKTISNQIAEMAPTGKRITDPHELSRIKPPNSRVSGSMTRIIARPTLSPLGSDAACGVIAGPPVALASEIAKDFPQVPQTTAAAGSFEETGVQLSQ